MKIPCAYKLLVTDSPDALSDWVTDFLMEEEGWQLYGSPGVFFNVDHNEPRYGQAIVQYAPNDFCWECGREKDPICQMCGKGTADEMGATDTDATE